MGVHRPPGQARDREGADALLPELLASPQALRADKAYDATVRGLDRLKHAGGQAVRPPKKTRKDPRAYEEEREQASPLCAHGFAKLTQCRGMATRDDQRATTSLGADYLAAVIWLH
jgi:hypothetical protein